MPSPLSLSLALPHRMSKSVSARKDAGRTYLKTWIYVLWWMTIIRLSFPNHIINHEAIVFLGWLNSTGKLHHITMLRLFNWLLDYENVAIITYSWITVFWNCIERIWWVHQIWCNVKLHTRYKSLSLCIQFLKPDVKASVMPRQRCRQV